MEDLLQLEGIGQAAPDPSGRWQVLERLSPIGAGHWFEADITAELALSRLQLVDLAHPGPPRDLLPAAEGQGVVLGPFAPGGDRLAVYRFAGRRWTLGVASLPDGAVRWLGVTPEDGLGPVTVAWASDRELLVLARPDGRPPWWMRKIWEAAERLPPRWAAAARGDTAVSLHGSGALRDLRPRPPSAQLLSLDLRSGTRQVLAEGPFTDMALSPDGRRLALLETTGDLQPRPDAPVQGAYGMATERHGLVVLDRARGRLVRPAGDLDLMESLLLWSPDSRALLAYARPPGAPWAAGGLVRYDAGARRLVPIGRAIVPELRLRPESVQAGWMGGAPVVFGRPAADPRARPDWVRLTARGPVNLTRALAHPPSGALCLDARGLTVIAGGDLWRLDPQGRPTRLAAGPLRAWRPPRPRFGGRAGAEIPASGPVLVLAQGAQSARLLAFDAQGARPALALPAGSEPLAYVAAGHALLTLAGPRVRRQTLTLVTPGAATPLLVTNPHLEGVDVPRIRRIAHPGPDGQPLASWLFLPPDPPAPGAAPPPLVVRPYPGATYPTPFPATPLVDEAALSIETLAGRGYAVLLPSLPKPRRGDPLAGLADQLLAVIDAAARDPALQGAFDPHRLALWGHSYGGYGAALIASQTDRFSAAILQSAPTDLAGMHGTFQPSWRVSPEIGVRVANTAGWTEDSQGGMEAPPYAAPERYTAASPVYRADRIRTPLLIFRGDQDFVGLAQGEMLFSELYRQDRNALLVTYWGEGHALGAPATVRDRYARILDWLDRYLGAPDRAAARPGAGDPQIR